MRKTKRILTTVLKTRVLSWTQAAGLSPNVLGFFAMLAVVPLFIRNEYVLHMMVVCLYFGAQAVAFDFTAGFINVVNFGFAAFVGLGAYTSALLAVHLGVSPWLGLLIAPAAAGLVGFLTGILTLGLTGIHAAVMAWFVGLALMGVASAHVDLTRGYSGLIVPLLPGMRGTLSYFYTVLPIAVLTYLVLGTVAASRTGLAFRALGQHLRAARASGVNSTKYRVINFTLSCAFAGLLGSFYAHFIGVLTPELMSTRSNVEVLALCYVGGRGSLWGGLIAAFLIIPIFEYLKPLMEIRLIIYGVLLILVMIFYPGGLAGVLHRLEELIRPQRRKRQ